ncbi:MAG: tetratricopeptide repeat protein [Myxococcota bacterium]
MSGSNELDVETAEAQASAEGQAVSEETTTVDAAPRELTSEEQAKLAELDEQREKFESQKRWSDVIKTILAKADIVVEPTEKVALLSEAGNMYIERSSNQAEAIKCFEAVLEHDPHNLEAITRLKEMYEKRRDWESLINTMQRECELLDEDDRPLRYVEMAQLATERLRKPEICIQLWQQVLAVDPEHPDALQNLATMYERARQWEPLAEVLEKLADATRDENELKQQLQKLGMIYADKVGDDQGAVRAFQKLLTLDPDDRRAQEQLKRRYVSLKAWDELEEFYAQSEKWDELIRILEREAEGKETSDEEKIELLFHAARLWEEKKEKVDRAARAYEKILDTDPQNLRAAEALTPIYEQAKDARKLVGVYEVRLGHSTDPAEKIALLREAGLLYEERLRDPSTAFEKFLQAFATDPTQDIVREDVERLAEATGDWSRLIDAYNQAIAAAQSEEDHLALRMSFGSVLRKNGNIEDAIAQYRAVYDARGDHPEAIAALAELYRETENYRELMEIYDRRMELETDPEQRRAIAYGKASLLESELGDANQAIEAYRSIIEGWGDEERDAYRALDRLYEAQERWEDLASILERLIDLGPDSDEELAALKFRLGHVLEQQLDRKERAVELYREVLTFLPEHDGAREALERLMDDPQVGVHAARILEPIYEVAGAHEQLIRALTVLHDGAETREDQLALMTKIGEVYAEQVGDPEQAFQAYCQALREAPESEATLARLEMLAVEQEKFGELVQLVGQIAGQVGDPPLSRMLWLKAANMHDVQLGDVDGAVGAYKQILEQDPGDLEVLAALEALYRRTERWRDLTGVLRRRAELATDPAEKEELLAQTAAIYDQFLEEPQEAIRIHKEILEIDPTSQRALSALDDLYARQEMWTDLADNVQRQLEMVADPDDEIALMLRLADLREKRMEAVEAAIEIYREVLERDAQNTDALGALERLLEQPEHQLVIAEILEPIYRDANQFERLIGVHEIQAHHASSPDRRVELLHRIAELYEVALDRANEAFQSFARALAEDPGNSMTQEQLERMARATGGMEALAQVYEQQVQNVEDPQLASTLHMKAAEIREEQLGDNEGAIAHFRRVLELDPQHLEAATALERLFQLAERYEELATIYLAKARMLTSPDEQKDYLFRAAQLYEEILERPNDAIGVYDQVLEIDPEELQALDKLIELYLRLEQWEKLLSVYTRKADIVVDPDEKKRLYVEVGAVYERELGDVEKAIDTYQRILEIDPDDLTAIGRLDALYQATENWEELLSVLEREADLAGDPNEVISYRYRIAELWDHRLGDPMRAVDIYREILESVPDHEPTLNALEAMIEAGKEPLSAAGVLEPVYRQFGQADRLIHVHEVQVAHEQDPLRKVELLHQIAELYEFQLDQPEQAFQAFARALPLDSRNEHTLGSLERLAEQTDAWPQVAQLYDTEIQKLREEAPEDVVDMALRTAMIYEVQLGDVDSAIERYNLVVEADEGHVQAIEALDRLYEQTERWGELAEVLRKEIAVAPSPEEILNLQFRLGQVYQNYLGDVDQAIEQYREILAAAPEHVQAMGALELLFAEGVRPLVVGEILEPLYRMQEAWDKLLNIHEVQLNYQGDPIERVNMMHRIAEIAEERANDHVRAFAWVQRALLEDPKHDHSLSEVERLSSMLDGWMQLADTYAQALERTEDPEARLDVAKRQARVFEEEIGDVQAAEAAYRYALGVNEADEDVLANLDRIYLGHGAYEALAATLKKRIAATDNPGDLVELNHRLGQVLENELGRTDEAIQVYRHVIEELDPQHHDSIKALQEIYTRREDWPNLLASFEKELDVVFGDEAQAEILAKMAWLAADRLQDPDKAIELWRRVLDVRGEDAEALNALGNIYAAQENWKDLVDILEREVAIAEDDEVRIRIYADLGRIWYEKLERDRSALDSWERVLDIDPANVEALTNITEIHRAGKQWHEMVDTLHRIIEVGAATLDDATIEHVYMQLGFLYYTELEQPVDAVEAYSHAVEINPRNFEALDALEFIHRNEGQWEAAIGVMEKRAEVLDDPDEQVQQLLTIAHTWEEQLGDADRGTSAYQRIVELRPMHEYAFKRLEELHRDAERWEDLVETYLARVEATEDSRERVALLRRVAYVYEKRLGDRENAYEALQVAWMEDFGDIEVRNELERITALTQKWNELLAVANQALQESEDPETKINICLACGKWYGEALNHPEYAIPYYQQVLALDPANVRAMRQTADLYRVTQQWQMLAQVLGRLVDMEEDPADKARTYVQMGDLCEERLGIPEQAPGYYLKALEVDPRSVSALGALERIYRQQQDWQNLLDVLQRKADALEDVEREVETRLQIAEVYEIRLENVDRAIDAYQGALDLAAQNLRALKGLERLYAQTERWQDLREVLEAQYDVVSSDRERIQILMRVASMWEEEFLKPDKAAERLEQVLDIDPDHEEALVGLERLYRQLQSWEMLIQTYERHVTATPDRSQKVRIYKAIGDVFANELEDPDRSIDAYLNVFSIDENDVEAIDALTRLYEKREDHASALEMMEKLARLVDDPRQQVDLHFRMGRILDGQLGDRGAALEHFERATELDSSHLESLEAMRRIHVDSGDWLAASKILKQEIEHQEKPREKAALLVELGRIQDERLEEHKAAIASYEQALENDEENEAAALPLVNEYFEQERWGDAFPLLQLLVRTSAEREPDEQHRLSLMLGQAAGKVGEKEEAIRALTKAYQIDAQHLPTLIELAAAHYRAEEWEKAFKFYQMLLVQYRESLDRDQITDIFYRLGVIKREQGERRKAINMFDKALEEDAHHRPTLEAVVGLYEKQGEWEQVIHFKKELLDVAENDDERFQLLEEIGDLWKEKVKNQQKAIEAYSDAADIKPEDHKILHKLLLLYQETRQWEQAIDTIQRISDLDDRQQAKAKYAYTVGVIIRDELKDPEGAIQKFNEALDLDPDQLKPFEAINKIFTQKKDWKGLERAFRKMIHRVVGQEKAELEFNLWHNLGIIYRDRLRNFESAAEAFRMASRVQPDDPTEHQILAELFAAIPGRIDDAIEEHQWLLRNDPFRVDSYRALYKLYFDARAYDKAWCLAATLSFLQKADAEQQQFYNQYKQQGMIRPKSRLSNEQWIKELFHNDEDRFVSKIMELVGPAVHAAKTASDKQLHLYKKYEVDPNESTVTFARTFGFVSQVLNLQIVPRLFLRQDAPGGLAHVPGSNPPATVCGSALLSGYSPQDLAFIIGRHLSYYRLEHFIRTMLTSHSEIKTILLAALRLTGVSPAPDQNVEQTASLLQQRLTAAQVDGLRGVCRKFMEAGARTDVKRWIQTAELTGCRAGFLLCNDLDTASRMIQQLPTESTVDLPPKEKVKEMVLFSVSEEYFRLREALGIQIQV